MTCTFMVCECRACANQSPGCPQGASPCGSRGLLHRRDLCSDAFRKYRLSESVFLAKDFPELSSDKVL